MPTSTQPDLMPYEAKMMRKIGDKDKVLHVFFEKNTLNSDPSLAERFHYMTAFKNLVGNFHNDITFLAALLAKRFLEKNFGTIELDVGEKPQGAPGIDIKTTTADGLRICCEIKTTKPYQPGFGASQKTAIKKDLAKLHRAEAELKFMMVTDRDAFSALGGQRFEPLCHGILIVDILTEETFSHDWIKR